MNYLELINNFWDIYEEREFSSNEVHLYFYLLNACNSRGWQNPFEYPNKRIVLATGMAEKTLIEVRNRLQQKGLITFESGKRNAKSPVYYLLEVSKMVSKKVSKVVSKKVSKEVSHIINNKDNNNNIIATPLKKGGGLTLNSKARKVFEEHYLKVFDVPYYWTAKDAGNMSQLLKKLQYLREQKNLENSDDEVINALQCFLDAINNDWVNENYSVSIINSKFNEIISNIRKNNNSHGNKQSNISQYEKKQSDSEQRKYDSLAKLDEIRAKAEEQRKKLQSAATA